MTKEVMTNFAIGTEPYATLTYGDMELKIGLTLLHNLEGHVLSGEAVESSYWIWLQNFSQALTQMERLMWRTIRRETKEARSRMP